MNNIKSWNYKSMISWHTQATSLNIQKRIYANTVLFSAPFSYHLACLKLKSPVPSPPPSSKKYLKRVSFSWTSCLRRSSTPAAFPLFSSNEVPLNVYFLWRSFVFNRMKFRPGSPRVSKKMHINSQAKIPHGMDAHMPALGRLFLTKRTGYNMDGPCFSL